MALPHQRQLHVWISEDDYAYLTCKAAEDDTTLGAIVRSLLRQARRARSAATATLAETADAAAPRRIATTR